jgi:hypothetical protein
MPETDQNPGVPDTMESSRRWSGFVCPDCRFVFRVPRDHDGRAIVCPSCRRMLRIPGASDTPPLLVLSLRSVAAEAAAEEADRELVRRSKRKKKSRKSEDHGWDQILAGSELSGNDDKRQMFWWLIGGATLLALIVTVTLMAMLGGDGAKPADTAQPPAPPPPPTAAAANRAKETPEVPARSEVAFLTEAEPMAKRFMEAASIEDLLPLVRQPDLAEGRMKNFYPGGKITPPGMSAFNTTSGVTRTGSILGVMVRNRNFEEKPLYFIESPSEIRIDWESWVGWSEISWDDFLAHKPTAPKLFRVTLSPVEYYNFAFADEMKWQSYRMESPDGNHSLYGYVERDSPLNGKLRLPTDIKQMALTLVLGFPDKATSSNQVIIRKYITEGWVMETEATP